MKNIHTIIALLVICIMPVFSEETKPVVLPGKVAYDKALDDATKVFTQAKVKALDKYKKDLKKALVDETKSGNLDTANAINAEIKSLEDEQAKLLGMEDTNPKVAIVGKWDRVRNGGLKETIVFKDDNTVLHTVANFSGKWSIKEGKLLIEWPNNTSDSFDMATGDTLTGQQPNGSKLSLVRVK